jgi:hypothetical protein
MDNKRYLHTVTAGAWLPMLQSGLSGLIAFILVLVIGLAARWRSPLTAAGVIGVTVWALAWLSLWRHWLTLTRFDQEGQPEPTPSLLSQKHELRVIVSEIKDNGHLAAGQYYDFPCTIDQLQDLARGLIDQDRAFSEREWTGAGRPFSIGGFRDLRREFISRGLVCLASGLDQRQGYILTLEGRRVLGGVLSELPPLPHLVVS